MTPQSPTPPPEGVRTSYVQDVEASLYVVTENARELLRELKAVAEERDALKQEVADLQSGSVGELIEGAPVQWEIFWEEFRGKLRLAQFGTSLSDESERPRYRYTGPTTAPRPEAEEPPEPEDTTPLVEFPRKPAVYVLEKVDGDSVTPAQLGQADGLSLRVSAATLNPRQGAWSDRYLKQQFTKARQAGKPLMLRVMVGKRCPAHLKERLPSYQGSDNEGTHDIPVPWTAGYRAWLRDLHAFLGPVCEGEPIAVVCVIGGQSGSGEMHESAGLREVRGYSADKMLAVYQLGVDLGVKTFPRSRISINTPKAKDGYSTRLVAYLKETYPRRGVVQNNSLSAKTPPSWIGYRLVVESGMTYGWQMVGPSANRARFGGSFGEAWAKVGDAAFVEVYRGDLDEVPRR